MTQSSNWSLFQRQSRGGISPSARAPWWPASYNAKYPARWPFPETRQPQPVNHWKWPQVENPLTNGPFGGLARTSGGMVNTLTKDHFRGLFVPQVVHPLTSDHFGGLLIPQVVHTSLDKWPFWGLARTSGVQSLDKWPFVVTQLSQL